MSACGECNVCCTVMGVDEISKAPGVSCHHLCNKGCSIYQFRPASCKEFECLWLQMQERETPLPKALRPDRCGVMFVPAPIEDTVAAHCESREAFDDPLVQRHVMRWLREGISVVRIVGDDKTLMTMRRQ